MTLQFNLNKFIHYLLPEDWPESVIEMTVFTTRLLIIILFFMIMRRFINNIFDEDFTNKVISKTGHDPKRANTINTLTKNLSMYILYFFVIYALLTNLGFPVGSLLAGAGIAGVAIGLGAQDLITDMINGFFIIFENQFKVGDLVEIPSEEIIGSVKSVGIRTTIIEAASGDIYYIPNSLITTVNNKSRSHRQILIEIPIADETDIKLFETAIESITGDVYQQYQDIIIEEPNIVGIVRGPDLTFNYRIAFKVKVGEDYLHTSKFYRHYILDLQARNIKIPSSVYDEHHTSRIK